MKVTKIFQFHEKRLIKIFIKNVFKYLDVDDEYHDEDGDLENGGSVNQALVQKGNRILLQLISFLDNAPFIFS